MNLFERLKDAAPVDIKTQLRSVLVDQLRRKMADRVHANALLHRQTQYGSYHRRTYLRTNYAPFYNTEDFPAVEHEQPRQKRCASGVAQLAKWPAKEIIYNFTKDAEYRDNKTKRGSLHQLIVQQMPFNFIDDSFHFFEMLDAREYYQPANDFWYESVRRRAGIRGIGQPATANVQPRVARAAAQ